VHLFYLHGFASSARSSKAEFLASRLAGAGMALHVPDLNEPDFSTITTTRMIANVRAGIAALPPAPVVLIGSSLGAFVAWHAAAQAQRDGVPVAKLILLAPALDFGTRRMTGLSGEQFAAWERTGWHRFLHHAYGDERPVHFELYRDAQRLDSRSVEVDAPGLVFMGRRDAIVSPSMVESFCAACPGLRLVWLDDEHQLAGSLDVIWREMSAFLGLQTD
jgi:hypothetical protein